MYRFLIIDDEPFVREGMAENIDWAAHGFQLVAACRDGREGMAAIEEHEPHVILSDICMPFVDGLELASFVAERYPATKTLLLTGYDDFHYAQEAVRLQVRDFLLKPVTATELRRRIDALREELDAEQNRSRQLERVRVQAQESLPLLRERFLHRLVRGALTAEQRDQRIELLGLALPGPWYCALLCDPDNVESEQELTELAVQNLVADVAEEDGLAVAFATARGNAALIVCERNAAATEAHALELGELIADRVIHELGITASIGIGQAVGEISRVQASYRGARQALEHRLVAGPNRITTLPQAGAAPPDAAPAHTGALRSQFARGLRTGSQAEAESALGALVHSLKESGCGVELCTEQMHRLLAESLSALEAAGVEYRSLPALGENAFSELARIKTLQEMKVWFTRVAGEVREVINSSRSNHSRSKASEATEYIDQHFGRADLSLSQICKALAVSKSYFSSLFKEHTGKTFVEYLTALRMDHAKELLATTDLKGYEVANHVGFSDAHYFSLTFRKQVGCSPTEYREERWGA